MTRTEVTCVWSRAKRMATRQITCLRSSSTRTQMKLTVTLGTTTSVWTLIACTRSPRMSCRAHCKAAGAITFVKRGLPSRLGLITMAKRRFSTCASPMLLTSNRRPLQFTCQSWILARCFMTTCTSGSLDRLGLVKRFIRFIHGVSKPAEPLHSHPQLQLQLQCHFHFHRHRHVGINNRMQELGLAFQSF